MAATSNADNKGHEALNPIHPSLVDRLDPAFVDLYNKHVANTPNKPIDLAVLRKVYSRLYSYGTAPAPEVGREWEAQVPGWSKYPGDIALRVYEPAGEKPSAGWPVHFDFHGGGWGLGDLETEAHICRHICSAAGVVVIDVDYRLVPEFPFPIGIEDCFAATRHCLAHAAEFGGINPAIVTLGGVSAGANIALVVNHLTRDAGIPVRGVVVGTPTIADLRPFAAAADCPFPSVREMEFAPTLNWARLKWFDKIKWDSIGEVDEKTKEERMRDVKWYADAATAPDWKGLADLTVIMTAECDPLRDEGEAYAKKVEKAGNKVVLKRFPAVPHPFYHMDTDLEQAREFIRDTCDYIKQCHT
ncbi:Uu.00g090530.m01.CDS01 [Anthostomella pinea]|uniref:Uu.00g090530.m01.CDS01 n=1 Tax=Anthostomella pinea TaxID=933095 RepID=A0AAI8VNI8_9PEZI|nr:Uu.00g090530.m01.CDS01 [Anthostomella pinea]